MITTPLVSIIVPCFNSGPFIEEALYSLIAQTYKDIEIIVVNDGSTDESEANIIAVHDSRIKYYSQPNSGQCAASNFGLSKSSGEYIKFFDADDVMHPEHIEQQMNCLNGNSEALCCCAWARFYDNDITTAEFIAEANLRSLEPLEWIKCSMHGLYDMMPGWSWLIPRNVIEKAGGWDERLSLNNDFEFSIRLLLHSSFVYFENNAKLYYRSGQTVSLSGIASENAFRAAFLSTKVGCSQLIAVEESKEMRLLCANKYSFWLYQVYPYYPQLVAELEKDIALLGGTDRKIDESPLMHGLQKIVGWKGAKRLKILMYQMGYRKYLLTIKKRLFRPSISHR